MGQSDGGQTLGEGLEDASLCGSAGPGEVPAAQQLFQPAVGGLGPDQHQAQPGFFGLPGQIGHRVGLPGPGGFGPEGLSRCPAAPQQSVSPGCGGGIQLGVQQRFPGIAFQGGGQLGGESILQQIDPLHLIGLPARVRGPQGDSGCHRRQHQSQQQGQRQHTDFFHGVPLPWPGYLL